MMSHMMSSKIPFTYKNGRWVIESEGRFSFNLVLSNKSMMEDPRDRINGYFFTLWDLSLSGVTFIT